MLAMLEKEHWLTSLQHEGWCIIPEALPPATIAALDDDLAETFDRTPFCDGAFYGKTTKRFGRLLARSPMAAALVQHELILAVVNDILSPWCDTIQLNVTQAIGIHPGAPPQLLHGAGHVGRTEGRERISRQRHLAAYRLIADDPGATAQIKANPSRTGKPPIDWQLYKERHQVECFSNKLKRFRRIALRCEKTLPAFMGFVHLACTTIWLR